jgi:hypothetical protein
MKRLLSDCVDAVRRTLDRQTSPPHSRILHQLVVVHASRSSVCAGGVAKVPPPRQVRSALIDVMKRMGDGSAPALTIRGHLETLGVVDDVRVLGRSAQ